MTALDDVALTLHLPVTIRRAEKADLAKLEWYGQYSHFRALIRRAYREQLRGRRVMLVADVNDFPVGQLFIQLTSSNSRVADGHDRAYLYSFRVMEMFQSQGIGAQLLHSAETLLARRGFQYATLSVAKHNERAFRLYRRSGYRIFGEDAGEWSYVDHHGHTHRVKEPCWMLEKKLVLR